MPRLASSEERPAARLPVAPVGAILNPKSHRNKHLRDIAIPGVMTVVPRTKQEIVEALERFARAKIGYLVIGGGDGTVRDVLTRAAPIFAGNWPRIIILPQGKTNALAHDLGLPGKWTLEQALEAAAKGRCVTRRPLLVEECNGEARTRYGFIFGAGVFNAAIEAGQVAHRFGAFQSFAVAVTAIFGVMQALFGFGSGPWRRQYGIRVSPGPDESALAETGRGRKGTRFLAGWTTLKRFPLGLNPIPGKVEPDQISYFFMDAPLRRAVALFPFAIFGANWPVLRRFGIHRGTRASFEIDLDDGFILDGEIYPAGNFSVRPGPEMRFVTP